MIRRLDPSAFPLAAEVIRMSFATVANDFGLSEQISPGYAAYTTTEKLQARFDLGWPLFGFFEYKQLVGCVSLSKESDNVFELHTLAVLPEHRHNGYGKQLLDFCVVKVRELGGNKIHISIVEENTALKDWYIGYGFVHTGTKKFEHLPFTSGYMELEV
jgi:ribosomal protein S18 acetylase RimI-like enzyme